jgi:hypothetical protein
MRTAKCLAAVLAAVLATFSASAGSISPREGWATHDTALGYTELLQRLKEAVKAEDMIVVTEAGPTEAARSRGVELCAVAAELDAIFAAIAAQAVEP